MKHDLGSLALLSVEACLSAGACSRPATITVDPGGLGYHPASGGHLTAADEAVLGNLFFTSQTVFATAYFLTLPAIELGV